MRSHIRAALTSSLGAIFLVLPLPVFSQAVQKQTKPSFVVESLEGTTTGRIITADGVIRMYLPDDMAAGDTISGTVSIEPNGATDAEKAQNRGVLEGYVIELDNQTKIPANQPRFTWTPAAPVTKPAVRYLLKIVEVIGTDGQTVASGNTERKVATMERKSPSLMS